MSGVEQYDLFVSGTSGYACYRIPALLATSSGTILAFCEARKYSCSDSGQIDLFLRRSADGGRTFGDPVTVASVPDWVCGNPAPVQDRETGTIRLLFCMNRADGDEGMICEGRAPRQVWACSSDDDGLTWDDPVEITASVKPNDWSWYATGPGHGVQLASGRLVVPCDHIVLDNRTRQDPYYSHVVYSDDGGETWAVGGSTSEGTNESTAEEVRDGVLYLNCRNKYPLADGGNYRAVAYSLDGGQTFSPVVHDAALPEPICQASVLRCRGAGGEPEPLLFANPAARSGLARGRHTMTVRVSRDGGVTWPWNRVLHDGPAAYSDLCFARDGTVVCLYERGEERPYERLTVARFALDWLAGAAQT
ncbi:MAG: sialidase family protein [bacterium]